MKIIVRQQNLSVDTFTHNKVFRNLDKITKYYNFIKISIIDLKIIIKK